MMKQSLYLHMHFKSAPGLKMCILHTECSTFARKNCNHFADNLAPSSGQDFKNASGVLRMVEGRGRGIKRAPQHILSAGSAP